ncbi:DUF5679 domain-containing protein [Dehalococcoides mccartyi]|jgi:hypothetical protein|uniref:DUF5679 domain-containing protein n=1 Tax=Dehalococcoides mccartyi TaxID=61435 RepID=UPI001C8F8EB3
MIYSKIPERRPAMVQAYCVKDRKKIDVKDARRVTLKNGRGAWQGTCPVCGGKVFRIG